MKSRSSQSLTGQADTVGAEEEGQQVGQAPGNGAQGDGDVAGRELIWELLTVEVAVYQATDLEQQKANHSCLCGTPTPNLV
jgi:hypothetical protein